MSIAVNPFVRALLSSLRASSCLLSTDQTKQLVAGINSSAEKLKEGVNENLRVFGYGDEG